MGILKKTLPFLFLTILWVVIHLVIINTYHPNELDKSEIVESSKPSETYLYSFTIDSDDKLFDVHLTYYIYNEKTGEEKPCSNHTIKNINILTIMKGQKIKMMFATNNDTNPNFLSVVEIK